MKVLIAAAQCLFLLVSCPLVVHCGGGGYEDAPVKADLDCVQSCSPQEDSAPVCAMESSGFSLTFLRPCNMRFINCKYHKDFVQVKKGECDKPYYGKVDKF